MKQVVFSLLLVSLCTVKLHATNCAVLAWFLHQQATQLRQAADRPSEIRKLQNEIGNKERLLKQLSLKSQNLLRDRIPFVYDDPASHCYELNVARITQTQNALDIARHRLAQLTKQDSE